MTQSLPQKSSNKALANHREPETMRSEHLPEPPSCTTCMASCALAGCLLLAIVLVGVALVIFNVIKNPCAILPDPMKNLLCREKVILMREPVIYEIHKLERLDMVELNLSTIVTVKQKHTLPPYTEILVYGVCGRATVGVDLAKMKDDDLIIRGSTITVTLPQAEVFSVDPTLSLNVAETDMSLVGESSDRKAESWSACNHTFSWTRIPIHPGTPELITDAQEQAMIQFRAIAKENDNLERAQRNAEKELAQFLMLAGYEQVIFVEPTELEEPVGEMEGVFQQLDQFLHRLGEIELPEPSE